MKNGLTEKGLIVFLTIIFLSFGSLSFSGEQSAHIVDINKQSYEVDGLTIEYRALGNWIGEAPKQTMPALSFSIEKTENRVSSTELFKISLRDIKRIVFKHQAGNYWTTFWVDIELKNGEKVSFDHDKHTYIKKDEKGNVVESLKGVDISGGSREEHNLEIVDFKGRAKVASGKEGAFSIPYYEVTTIEFH
jgi:hypothetical protein